MNSEDNYCEFLKEQRIHLKARKYEDLNDVSIGIPPDGSWSHTTRPAIKSFFNLNCNLSNTKLTLPLLE